MDNEIADALRVLQGLPMWGAGRAVTLLWLQFGGMHEVVGRYGAKTVGDHALHLECPWRIIERNLIVVGFADRLYPGGEGNNDPDFEWMDSKDTRLDRRLRQFIERTGASTLTVKAIRVGVAGAFSLQFEEDIALEVFPDNSVTGEYWRLFQPYQKSPHFVAVGDNNGRIHLEEQ